MTAVINEQTSQVRGKKASKGQGARIPHAATAVVGKGTPPIPPVEAVGVYTLDRTGAPIIPVSQEPLAQRPEIGGSTPDRSRSRDPPREITPVVPIAPQQVVMTVPEYMLPLMASAGLGHLSNDQPRMQNVGGSTPPSSTEAQSPNIRDFFEPLHRLRSRRNKSEPSNSLLKD